ncbi:MAG: (2Fe-2S)-binding protein [Betaproteobacteria bacterium]|nr:(2Fe-2S)-binding protein [Betaproteobacteria bacterium]
MPHLSLTVNGDKHELEVPANRTLFALIREDLGLVGTKDACRQGVCGSCTVLVDGVPMRSCLALAVRCQGTHITTVEGLKADGKLSRLQQEFINAGAVQCGYCTPGMLIMATALLAENPRPTETQVREALIGNLCRCTGYVRVVRAVMAAAS